MLLGKLYPSAAAAAAVTMLLHLRVEDAALVAEGEVEVEEGVEAEALAEEAAKALPLQQS